MQPQMTFAQGIIEVLIQLSPSFLVVCFVLIVFSWLRLLIDVMSGRGF